MPLRKPCATVEQMKSNSVLLPVAVVSAFVVGVLVPRPHAQSGASKVGFVNVQALFAAHPQHKSVEALKTKASSELGGLRKQIEAIQAKGASATAAEKQKLQTLGKTYNSKLEKMDKDLKSKAAPVEQAIDKALKNYATANGFSVIMDYAVAQQSGLVVYANSTTNVTEGVKKTIK